MSDRIDLNDADAVASLLTSAAATLRRHPNRAGCAVTLPSRGRLVVAGDLHDNVTHLQKAVSLAQLDHAADHHLIVQELIHGEHFINGMDFSYRMVCRVAELVTAYPQQVHPLLANHEIAQLTGKGVSKGAGNATELFEQALQYVFNDDWEAVRDAVNEFFASMPLALRSEGGLFCSHSLPNARMMSRFDPDVLQRDLVEDDYRGPTGAAYLMCWGRRYDDEQIAALARQWNVQLFILGHQHVEMGIEQRGERVICINSDHEHGVLLPVDLTQVPTPEQAVRAAIPLQAIGEPSTDMMDQ